MATTSTDTFMRPSQIDYKLRSVAAPHYKMMRIPLNNMPSASTKIGNSSVTLEWKLPTRVYNLARSYISYNIKIPAQPLNYTRTFEDVFDLGNSVTFGSAGGTDLVNLQYAQNYTKIARRIGTDLDDFLGNDDMSGLYKSGSTGGSNLLPGGGINASRAAARNYVSPESYIDTKYSEVSRETFAADPDMPPTINRELNRYRQYPLSAFVGTLLADDRDFYSPIEQYLRVQAGVADKIAFMTTANDVLSTGANSVNPAGAEAGMIQLNSIYLYLCVEQNQEIVDSMLAKYAEGKLAYRIPYTTAFKTVGSGAGEQTNISIMLSQQYGKRLKRILHTVFNPQEKFNTAYDCANWNGEKIVRYQTFLDSMPIQDRILSCEMPSGTQVNKDDWLENKKFLEKRSVYSSKEMHALNWFHIDQFYEPRAKDIVLSEVNLDEGIPMNTSKQWLFSAETGAMGGCIHYTFAEFTRDIQITSAGPTWI